jgi:RND family efflux transporter MFP subunit
MNKNSLKIIIPSVAAFAIIAMVAIVASRMEPKVLVTKAVSGTAADAVTGTVKVFANIDMKIKTEVQGRVSEVPYMCGGLVKKGDVLTTLDSQDLNNQIRDKVTQLKSAREKLKLSFNQEQDILSIQDDVERLKKQVEFGGASQSDLDRRMRELEKVKNDLALRKIEREEQASLFESAVTNLQFQLERMTVEAPMDGKVVEQYVWPGDYVWTGNQVCRLVSTGRWLELTLTEEDCAGVVKGQKVNVRLASYPDKPFTGTVTGLNYFANAEDKTRTVFLSVDASDELLVPGLTGEAVLVKAEHKNAVLIPRRALVGQRVYVVKNGKVEIRKVQPGFVGLDDAEIASGMAVGETVILEGQSKLKNGESVETQSATD